MRNEASARLGAEKYRASFLELRRGICGYVALGLILFTTDTTGKQLRLIWCGREKRSGRRCVALPVALLRSRQSSLNYSRYIIGRHPSFVS